MNIEKDLQLAIIKVIAQLYDAEVSPAQIKLQKTKKQFIPIRIFCNISMD